MPNLERELDAAIKIVRSAGAILMTHRLNPTGIGTKVDGSVVSDVDKKASSFIQKELTRQFPSYGILNEESAEDRSRFDRDYCWFVDPLDDTRGYLNRSATFGVILGLTHRFKPVLGVTYKPSSNELTWAIRGSGVYHTFKDITSQISVSKDQDTQLLISSNRSSPELEQMIARLQPDRTTKMGGSLKIVEIAKGTANIFLCPKSSTMHLWDLCGTSVILEEAGGKITDLHGNPFDYSQRDTANRNGVAATNGILHEKAIYSS